MRIDELSDGIIVRNTKYDTAEQVLVAHALMKDSKKGWIPAVYTGAPTATRSSRR